MKFKDDCSVGNVPADGYAVWIKIDSLSFDAARYLAMDDGSGCRWQEFKQEPATIWI